MKQEQTKKGRISNEARIILNPILIPTTPAPILPALIIAAPIFDWIGLDWIELGTTTKN